MTSERQYPIRHTEAWIAHQAIREMAATAMVLCQEANSGEEIDTSGTAKRLEEHHRKARNLFFSEDFAAVHESPVYMRKWECFTARPEGEYRSDKSFHGLVIKLCESILKLHRQQFSLPGLSFGQLEEMMQWLEKEFLAVNAAVDCSPPVDSGDNGPSPKKEKAGKWDVPRAYCQDLLRDRGWDGKETPEIGQVRDALAEFYRTKGKRDKIGERATAEQIQRAIKNKLTQTTPTNH